MVGLVFALLLCGGVFYLLEKYSGGPPEKPAERPATVEKKRMPPRSAEKTAAMGGYSSAVHPQKEAAPVPLQKHLKTRAGTVAIIVDDMGNSTHEADALLSMDVPITFSLIPGFAKVRQVADAAHRKGEEVMVHMPMEPKGYQGKPFEKNGLLLAMSDEEIERRVKGYLSAIPYAVGANNHMGSRFTEDRPKMQAVLAVLRGKGLFFIDSKTSPASVGDKLAREMGIPCASRNVFLDNVQDVGAISVQIEKLADMAKKNGSAIGICHPHKTTLQALAATLPRLRAEGITFVHVSSLVR